MWKPTTVFQNNPADSGMDGKEHASAGSCPIRTRLTNMRRAVERIREIVAMHITDTDNEQTTIGHTIMGQCAKIDAKLESIIANVGLSEGSLVKASQAYAELDVFKHYFVDPLKRTIHDVLHQLDTNSARGDKTWATTARQGLVVATTTLEEALSECQDYIVQFCYQPRL